MLTFSDQFCQSVRILTNFAATVQQQNLFCSYCTMLTWYSFAKTKQGKGGVPDQYMAKRHAINELSGLKIKSFFLIIISLLLLQVIRQTCLSVFLHQTLCHFIKICIEDHNKKSNVSVDQQTVTFCLCQCLNVLKGNPTPHIALEY